MSNNWLEIERKVIIVTGGTSGIGRQIVNSLLENGAIVYNVDLKDNPIDNEHYYFIQTDVTDEEAVQSTVSQIEVKNIPRHKINHDDRGLFKVVVDADSQLILGGSLYGKESEELINILKLAMDQQIPYTVLRDNIYTHPTMSESFNDLFNI